MDQFLGHLWALWDSSKSTLALFGFAGISIATVVGAAFTLFKLLGEKWLNQKFAERLEAYKSEQARELERLRHRISGVFDRAKRLNDREYDVLPDVWAKLVDANSSSIAYLSRFRQYPDITRMSDTDLDEYLDTTKFSASQKKEIKSSSDRLKAYQRVSEWHYYAATVNDLRAANSAISKNGIFIVPTLRDDMKRLVELIHSAIVEQQINDEHEVHPRMKEGRDKWKSEGEPLFKKIEEAVAARLWDAVSTEV